MDRRTGAKRDTAIMTFGCLAGTREGKYYFYTAISGIWFPLRGPSGTLAQLISGTSQF